MPKPEDWGPELDVVGYLFLHEGKRSSYQPPPSLAAFLAAGPPPVYIGTPLLHGVLRRLNISVSPKQHSYDSD